MNLHAKQQAFEFLIHQIYMQFEKRLGVHYVIVDYYLVADSFLA